MSVEPLRTVRDHLSEFVDRVEHQHERIVLTRNGHAAAVLISPEDLAQMEETIDVLSDPQALADIAKPTRPTPAATSSAGWRRCAGCTGERAGGPANSSLSRRRSGH